MAIPSRQLVPGWGRWGPVAGVGSSRRLSGSGCYAGCWPGGSSPASGWSWGTQWWTGGASAGRHCTRRGLSGCWRRGHGDDGRGPCRCDRGFHSHWEGSCGRRSRMSGAGRGCPLSRRRVGWPGLHTWHRRGVGWGPRGLCPRTIAIPAFSRHFRGAARMPGGQWREGCLLGWRRRWWRERRPWCLQRPGGGWGGLGLRCRSWAILTEPGSASVTFFLAEVAVVSWWGAVLTFGNAVDARVRAAALCADCLVGTAAGRVAVALTVVALPGTRLRRGRGRCLRRLGGGSGALARLGLSLASVLWPPTPLVPPCHRRLSVVFRGSSSGVEAAWARRRSSGAGAAGADNWSSSREVFICAFAFAFALLLVLVPRRGWGCFIAGTALPTRGSSSRLSRSSAHLLNR